MENKKFIYNLILNQLKNNNNNVNEIKHKLFINKNKNNSKFSKFIPFISYHITNKFRYISDFLLEINVMKLNTKKLNIKLVILLKLDEKMIRNMPLRFENKLTGLNCIT